MKLGLLELACFAFTSLLVGCSSGDDDSNKGSGSPEALNPPANVDASICASTSASSTDGSACIQCCNTHSFQGSTDYDGRCVCGNQVDTAGATVCKSSSDTDTACSTCCDAGGYSGYTYAAVGSMSSCTCSSKSDATICKGALSASNPDDACRVCCLNQGYLGDGYTGFGTPECRCFDI
jgi:hypothetical protein